MYSVVNQLCSAFVEKNRSWQAHYWHILSSATPRLQKWCGFIRIHVFDECGTQIGYPLRYPVSYWWNSFHLLLQQPRKSVAWIRIDFSPQLFNLRGMLQTISNWSLSRGFIKLSVLWFFLLLLLVSLSKYKIVSRKWPEVICNGH